MDHDQNFKNLILDYPRQALAFFAAYEANGIDESASITPIRQEQLKARLGDRFRELAALPATDYEDSDKLVARLNLMNMHWTPSDKVRLYAQAIRGLLNLDNNPKRHAKYLDFIDSYATLTDNERRDYEQRFSEESKAMTGIVTRAREEGMQKGVEQGLEQGISQGEVRGERAMLERLLTRRFGELDAATLERLDNASSEELEQWADNVIEAQSLQEAIHA